MSYGTTDSLMDILQFVASRVGIVMEHRPISWSSVSGLTVATLASAFVLFRLVYRYSEKLVPPPSQENEEDNETMSKAMQRVKNAVKPEDGTVKIVEILIHPIKSCRGTSVQSCKYSPQGLENDREWAFVDATTNRIITAREFPRMVLIHPRIEADPTDPSGGCLVIGFPSNAPEGCTEFRVPLHPSPEILKDWQILDKLGLFAKTLDGYIGHAIPIPSPSSPPTPSTASAISSLYFSKPVHLVYKGPRPRRARPTASHPTLDAHAVFQDGYPLLILSRESLAEVEAEVREHVGVQAVGEEWRDGRIEVRRFRPNVVVEGAGGFAEDAWEEVTFGNKEGPLVHVVSRCVRCLLPNVSPESGIRDKAVPFKVLAKFRTGLHADNLMGPCVGCNGAFTGSGVVNVGDVVYVKKMVSL